MGVPKLDAVSGGHLDVVRRLLAMQMEQVEDGSQWPPYQVQVAIRRAKGERGPRDSGSRGCPAHSHITSELLPWWPGELPEVGVAARRAG